jgi:HNH endonuclease
MTPYERIMRRAEPRGDCLVMTGWTDAAGSPRVSTPDGTRRPPRVVWEHHHGPIPEGMVVCHSCDVPACVAIEHLWIGTQADNLADMRAKGRARTSSHRTPRKPRPAPTHCPAGHEYLPGNTYTRPNGARECRTCRDARQKARRAGQSGASQKGS